MEPGGSLPHSQEPATCPYPELAQSSPCPHPTSLRSILILSYTQITAQEYRKPWQAQKQTQAAMCIQNVRQKHDLRTASLAVPTVATASVSYSNGKILYIFAQTVYVFGASLTIKVDIFLIRMN
jgi:type III secretory pathway component EscT